MPTTYQLISSTVISSTPTYGVTFSSIPQTYTDLVIRMTTKMASAVNVDEMNLYFNGATGSYSSTRLRGNGSTAASGRNGPSGAYQYIWGVMNDAQTDAFSNAEIYIPNYTADLTKQNSVFGVTENNTGTAVCAVTAGYTSTTSAISSITIDQGFGYTLRIGSAFYLYGIKNS
jgi:hypothetical protein